MGCHELVQEGKGGVVLPAGTGPHSPPTTYPNNSGRNVVVALTHVSTTDSGLITPPTSMKALPGENTSNTQSPPPKPLVCVGYPPSKTFVLTLSGSVTHLNCGLIGSSGSLLHQSAVKTQTASIVDLVNG